MGLGGSLILIATGAILRWAITASTSGVNIHTVGLILLIVGGIGFVISLLWMAFMPIARRAGPTPTARVARDREGIRSRAREVLAESGAAASTHSRSIRLTSIAGRLGPAGQGNISVTADPPKPRGRCMAETQTLVPKGTSSEELA